MTSSCKRTTEVVAALLRDGAYFMICQRPANKARGLLWEFVGGKVEAGESHAEALVRECREELGIEVTVGDIFCTLEHVYPDITIQLTLYNCQLAEGVPTLYEHKDLRWILPEDMERFDFCPADKEILERIQAQRQAGVW